MITEFTTAVCEKIGFYVYVLKDPRSNQIFYIGRGKENRIFQHLYDSTNPNSLSEKLDLIREIGIRNVQHYILRHNLTEDQAKEIESACIDLLGLDNLSNSISGFYTWERGLKTIDEIVQFYDAKIITITEPSIIININRLYRRFMTPQELYDATRSSWVLSSKRNDVRFAIASYRGLVREVFEIGSWVAVGKRWEFNGAIANNDVRDKYLNQSLEKYISQGGRNPIKYIL